MVAPLHNLPYVPRAPSAVGHGKALTAATYSPPLTVIFTGDGGDIKVTLAGDDTEITIKATVAHTFITGLAVKTIGSSPPANALGFW